MDFLKFNLEDWLYYLENSHTQEIQLGLERITSVAKKLDLLQWSAQVISVAGTNGKGSTVTALETIYMSAGYKVATYTSPHLLVFNERIRVNATPISNQQLCAAFLVIEQARESTPLTYFEMTTLAALWHFRQLALDVIILEVGLGGRLDATNIIDSELAIITTIDFDHQAYLGDTKEAIGYEKAGILRAKKPLIYADNNPPISIIKHAAFLNVPMYSIGVDYSLDSNASELTLGLSKVLQTQGDQSSETLTFSLPMINPKAAAAALIASICLNRRLPCTLPQLREAMRKMFIVGRQHVVKGAVTTVFDVAHNPQAVLLLAEFIQRYQPKQKVHAVFSGLKDKDLCGLIRPMLSFVDAWYPAILSGKRAATEAQLLAALDVDGNQVPACCYSDPLTAYNAAINEATSGDLIVVYGSFLTVSAIMSANREVLEELQ